jgi:hypothetical protein
MKKISKTASIGQIVMVSLLSLFVVATMVMAATTIGTNINTGGAIYATSTLLVDGASTFRSTVTLQGANLLLPPSYSLDVSTGGVLNIGTTTATAITIGKANMTTNFPGYVTMANASSTNASSTLASFGGGTTISTILWGTCSYVFSSVAASSTAYATCTGSEAATNAYKVLVTPSASSSMVLTSASSTVNGIQVAFFNTGYLNGAVVGALANTFVNIVWMAIK